MRTAGLGTPRKSRSGGAFVAPFPLCASPKPLARATNPPGGAPRFQHPAGIALHVWAARSGGINKERWGKRA